MCIMLVYMIQPQPMFFSQCDRPSFMPTQNKRQHYSFEHFNLYIFRQDIGRQQDSGRNCRRHSLSSILMKEISVWAEPKYLNLAILLYYPSSCCDSVLHSVHQAWTFAKFSQHLPLDKSSTTSVFFFTVLIFFSEIFLSYMGPTGTNHWSEGQLWQTIYPSLVTYQLIFSASRPMTYTWKAKGSTVEINDTASTALCSNHNGI